MPKHLLLVLLIIYQNVVQVAESWEILDGWVDAIRLVYTVYARGKSDVLAGLITG